MVVEQTQSIPQAVYDAYHLAYNNVTYRALRSALEEAALLGKPGTGRINEAFINDVMSLLIDSSFERCGAVLYRGSEARLLGLLRPLASNFTGLALRHLTNFGPSRVPAYPAPLPQLARDLNLARAELCAFEQDARRQEGDKSRIAAEWLKAAILLIGAAADRLSDQVTPGTVWRCGAQNKLTAAFFALKHGIEATLDEDESLPPKISDAVMQMIELLPPPPDPLK